MKAFSLSHAAAVIFGIFILLVSNSTFSQPVKFSPACAKIKEIAEQLKELKARRASITIGNKAGWCPLNKQQVKYSDEMIGIFESDPERCGVRDSIVERLKTSNQRLRESTATACGDVDAG